MSRSRIPQNHAAEAAKSPVFAGLGEDRVAELLSLPGVSVEHYEAGKKIRDRDTRINTLAILLYGKATVEKKGVSGRMQMSILEPLDLFGAAALFSEENDYVAEITAAESTWILTIPEESLLAMMREEKKVIKNYLEYLTGRIRFLSGRVDMFAEENTNERVFRFLKTNAKEGVFTAVVTLTDLAGMLSISRATLYRALDELESAHRIRRNGKTIEICMGV